MASSTKSVVIHAPVEKVQEYLADPMHLPEIWPSLIEVKDVQLPPDGGLADRWSWTYKMLGTRLTGTNEVIERTKEGSVSKTKGGIESTQTWTFEPQGTDTKVTFKVDYAIPVPVLGRLAEAAIVKLNDHEGDAILENLKAIVEAT